MPNQSSPTINPHSYLARPYSFFFDTRIESFARLCPKGKGHVVFSNQQSPIHNLQSPIANPPTRSSSFRGTSIVFSNQQSAISNSQSAIINPQSTIRNPQSPTGLFVPPFVSAKQTLSLPVPKGKGDILPAEPKNIQPSTFSLLPNSLFLITRNSFLFSPFLIPFDSPLSDSASPAGLSSSRSARQFTMLKHTRGTKDTTFFFLFLVFSFVPLRGRLSRGVLPRDRGEKFF